MFFYSPNLKFVIENPPALNQVGELDAIMTTAGKDSMVSLEIKLSEGIELVDGDLFWLGNIHIPLEELEKHKPPYSPNNSLPLGKVIHKIKFKPTRVGKWVITGRLNSLKPGTVEVLQTVGISNVYLMVLENQAFVKYLPFPGQKIPCEYIDINGKLVPMGDCTTSEPIIPCEDMYIDGELVHCTTSEP